MTKVIEFNGLRTSTSYNFKNKKEECNFWDNLLIESPLRFRNEYSKFLHEKLHVIFSLSQIFRLFAALCAFLTLMAYVNSNGLLFVVNGISTIICLGLFGGYYLKFKSFAISVAVTDEIHTIEFVEALQEIVKETKSKI